MMLQYQFYTYQINGTRIGPFLLFSDLPIDLIPDVLAVYAVASHREDRPVDVTLVGEVPRTVMFSDTLVQRMHASITPGNLEGWTKLGETLPKLSDPALVSYNRVRSFYSKHRI